MRACSSIFALLAGIVLSKTVLAVEVAEYEVVDVALATPRSGCHVVYTAIVFAVRPGLIGGRPPSHDPRLAELSCGSCRVGYQDRVRERLSSVAHAVPVGIVPLLHVSDFAVTDFVLRAHWTS